MGPCDAGNYVGYGARDYAVLVRELFSSGSASSDARSDIENFLAGQSRLVCLLTVAHAFSLHGLSYVAGARTCLQMIGSNATDCSAVTAMRNEWLVRGQGAISKHVGNTVGVPVTALEEKVPVTVVISRAGPNPAWSKMRDMRRDRSVLVNLRPEAIFETFGVPTCAGAMTSRAIEHARSGDEERYSALLASARDGNLVGHRTQPPVSSPGGYNRAGAYCVNFTTERR